MFDFSLVASKLAVDCCPFDSVEMAVAAMVWGFRPHMGKNVTLLPLPVVVLQQQVRVLALDRGGPHAAGIGRIPWKSNGIGTGVPIRYCFSFEYEPNMKHVFL